MSSVRGDEKTPQSHHLRSQSWSAIHGCSVQHGVESHNPRPMDIRSLDIISIHAYAANSGNQQISPIVQSRAIQKENHSIKISLSDTFVLAAAETAAELGIPLISARIATAVQSTLPCASKQRRVKWKTGKSGGSAGFAPKDSATTTTFDEEGMVCALKQDNSNEPITDPNIQLTPLHKPLEQVIAGLESKPPEFILESLVNNYLQVKLNTRDETLKNLTFGYQLDIPEAKLIKPIDFSSGREPIAIQPSWWDEGKFGKYSTRAICGYLQEYKKTEDGKFEVYQGYGRKISEGKILPFTGDQDLFYIPHTDQYKLGEDAYSEIDTEQESNYLQLSAQILGIYKSILLQNMQVMQQQEEELRKYYCSNIQELEGFLNAGKSVNFIKELGKVTPFEALVICKINMREIQLKKELEKSPGCLTERLVNVKVTSSTGISEVIARKLNIELHPSWFEWDSLSCHEHVRSQLRKHRKVSGKILFLHMQILNKNNPDVIGDAVHSNRNSLFSSNLAKTITAEMPFIVHKKVGWQIYLHDSNGIIKNFRDDTFDTKTISDIIICGNGTNGSVFIMHFNGNQVNSDVARMSSIRRVLATFGLALKPSISAAQEDLDSGQHRRFSL